MEVAGSTGSSAIASLPAPRALPRPATATTLGAYTIHQRIGVGGLATVYRARRTDDPRGADVALKRLHPHLLDDDLSVAAFVKEARIAVLLDHPAIRRVHALTRYAAELYLVMEYVEGASLLQLLKAASRANQLPCLAGALTILTRLCDVMHYAHELVDEHGRPVRFVHRDISPSNLILTREGRLKIIDLGVARAEVGDLATRSGYVKGKYGYMAPEVMEGERFDRRADIYSIGVVAWELLTAHKLFAVRGALAEVTRARSRAIEPPSKYNAECPPELDAIVLRALSANPTDRWPTAAFLRDALGSVAARLDRSLSDDAVLAWVHGLHATIDRDAERAEGWRFSRGTGSENAIAPPPPPPVVVRRRRLRTDRRARAHGAIAGAIATALLAVILAASCPAGTRDAAGATVDRRPTAERAIASADAAARVTRARPDASPADAGVRVVAVHDMVRVAGRPPRSRSTRARYRARVCVDRDGAVTSAALLEGPPRLESRILYALARWRYQPYTAGGSPEPVCFEVSERIEKIERSR